MRKLLPIILLQVCASGLLLCSAQSNRIWGTYMGHSEDEVCNNIATDSQGNVYITGETASLYNIGFNGFQNNFGGGNWDTDAFLVKYDSLGHRLWGTYYGNAGEDVGYDIAIDNAGNVYLAGSTTSTAGIASGGFQNTNGGSWDAFLVKFDADGNRLWSTFYGGSGLDKGFSVATTGDYVYLAGSTPSTSGIASGGFQNTFGGGVSTFGGDAFLVKFDSNGQRIWATYYGSVNDDVGAAITLDASENCYLAGSTQGDSAMAAGGFQDTFGGSTDAYLVKFDPAGNRLWATYYGGTGLDGSSDIATDSGENVYLVGTTTSLNGINSQGFDTTGLGAYENGYVVKFSSSGNRLWGRYYDGPTIDACLSVAVDAAGRVFLGGETYRTLVWQQPGGYQDSTIGEQNIYAAMFDSSGTLICGTYYGNDETDYFGGGYTYYGRVAVDNAGHLFLAGTTVCHGGIAFGGAQNTFYGGIGDQMSDAILVCFTKLSALSVSAGEQHSTCVDTCTGATDAYITGGYMPYTYAWNTLPLQTTQVATGLCAGDYVVTVSDAVGTTFTDTVTVSTSDTISIEIATADACGLGTATAMVTGGTAPYAYAWIPSGGNDASEPNLPDGVYSVIISDSLGCTGADSVNVSNTSTPATSYFVIYPDSSTEHNWFLLPTVSGTGTLTYFWEWGDGATSSESLPSHIYNAPGFYNICLTITDANSCSATYCNSSTFVYKTGAEMISIHVVNELPNGTEDGEKNRVKFYPNPAGNTLILETSATGGIYQLRDITGKTLLQGTVNAPKFTLDISDFSSGVYFISVTDGERQVNGKVVKE